MANDNYLALKSYFIEWLRVFHLHKYIKNLEFVLVDNVDTENTTPKTDEANATVSWNLQTLTLKITCSKNITFEKQLECLRHEAVHVLLAEYYDYWRCEVETAIGPLNETLPKFIMEQGCNMEEQIVVVLEQLLGESSHESKVRHSLEEKFPVFAKRRRS